MSRLIDADRFCDYVKENCKDNLADMWCELIRRQPTAYDVDKVVNELEYWKTEYENKMWGDRPMNAWYNEDIKAYSHAIDIVKQGDSYEG
jgi:hypothetical protein